MGQKTHPTGFRVGVNLQNGRAEDWQSRWYAPKTIFGDLLHEDNRIRKFLIEKVTGSHVAKVEIERTNEQVRVIIFSSRPGMIIGSRGQEIEKLTENLEIAINRQIKLEVLEIRNPDTEAKLIAENISEQLRKRANFRRVMKQKAEAAMQHGSLGVRITCSGRLGGHEMARRETISLGSVPLQKLSAHINYSTATAHTTYGSIGIKVWIHKGSYLTSGENTNAANAQKGKVPQVSER